jgi:hypothetical protein
MRADNALDNDEGLDLHRVLNAVLEQTVKVQTWVEESVEEVKLLSMVDAMNLGLRRGGLVYAGCRQARPPAGQALT